MALETTLAPGARLSGAGGPDTATGGALPCKLENAIADDAEHHGERDESGEARNHHQPAHFGDERRLLRSRAVFRRQTSGRRYAIAMTDSAIETVTIPPSKPASGSIACLAAHIPALSRSRLKALILAGQVTIAARTIRDPAAARQIRRRDHRHPAAAGTAEPDGEDIPLNIVYEDDALIVIDKPKGLVVHPAAGHATGTLVNALIAHCGDSLSGIGGVKRPGIVHRLDKDTTGLMVVAKNDRAHHASAASNSPNKPERPARARLSRVRLGRAGPAAAAPSTRRSTAIRMRARNTRCAQGGRDGRHPLGGAGALTPAQTASRSRASRLHAGNRPHPPDPRASRPYRPPDLGDATYGTGFKTKAARLRSGAPRWRASAAGAACLLASSTRRPASHGIRERPAGRPRRLLERLRRPLKNGRASHFGTSAERPYFS